MYKASVIVTTYNRLEHLKLVLKGYCRQTEPNFELIIADDGSAQPTVDYVNSVKDSLPFPVKYVWHEDNGFRKSMIVNKAIAKADSDYLIFADGECIPHRCFIAAHIADSKPNTFLYGRYVWLTKEFSAQVSEDYILQGGLEKGNPGLVLSSIIKSRKNFFPLLYSENRAVINLIQSVYALYKQLDLFGGNFSAFRTDILRINGYNEDFIGYGWEDYDIGERMLLAGMKRQTMIARAVCYHVWHPPTPRKQDEVDKNLIIAKEAISSGQFRCDAGVDQYLSKP